jgi:thioredoxin-related protein
VDGIEKEWNGKLKVVRINVQDNVGRELAPVYEFEYTPTFIFFDGQGREVWRTIGEIDALQVRESVLGNN